MTGQVDSTRVPMNVKPSVRRRLIDLLYRPDMQGVGYSDFLTAAMDAYERGEWTPKNGSGAS